MFKKLKRKILSLIVLTLTLSLIVVGLISYTAIKEIAYNNFIDLSINGVAQKVENVQIYLKLIEETSKQISKSPYIIESLQQQNFESTLASSLDGLKLSYSGILGVTLYDRFGASRASNNVTSYPALEQLRHNRSIDSFLSSSLSSFWSVRTGEIAEYYNNELYNKKYGIVTFITKIYGQDNDTLGYLFIDIDPSYVYDFFKNGSSVYINESQTFITNSEKILLPSKHNSSADTAASLDAFGEYDFSTDYSLSQDRKSIIIHKNLYVNDMKIISTIPLNSLYMELNRILFALVFIIFILILVSIGLGLTLASGIADPLTKLHKKMKENTV